MKITRKPILAAEYTYDQKVQMYEDIFRNVYKNLTDEQIHQRAVEQVDREEAFNRSREEERVKRANAIVTPEMESKLFDAAYEKRDISRIQKFIDLVNAGKITKDNYWDAITKYLTGRVMSDHVIHFWEAFCDYAYDTLYGKGVSATSRISGKRPIKAAESYGWEVPDDRAQEAYDFAIESGYWDEASLNADIVNAISTDELAACLAFIFRMNDFQEWDDYLNGEEPEDDEYEDEDEDK